MNRIDELISNHCPEGVDHKPLGEAGSLYSGLSGKSKMDFSGGNARFVSYVNIFNNLATDVSPQDTVRVSETERQNRVRYGDVLFTGSSESAEEVGMASGVTVEPPEPLYLNSFCFGFRPNNIEDLNPGFAKHLFRSESVRRQIIRTASGVTRINVSKERFRSIRIPVPPLAIQLEIASILDKMAKLETELEVELELRSRQFAYYRDRLLAFPGGARRAPMGDVATITRGASPRPIQAFLTDSRDGVPWIKIGDVLAGDKYITGTSERITVAGAGKSRRVRPGDFVLSNSMSFGRPYISQIDGCIHDGWLAISDFEGSFISDFLYHLLRSTVIQAEFARRAGAGTVKNLNAEIVRSVVVPVPPRSEQERIVAILDKFDALVNDLSIGLPAEIAARRQQYEYYRDKLLTFEEAS